MHHPIILHIETSTSVCSVALSRGVVLLGCIDETIENAHASRLTLNINRLLREQGVPFQDLDAVSVAKGPGSYTGLRIGVSTAKGLCYALDIPLLGIDSLYALASGYARRLAYPASSALMVPLFDARRMEVYRAVFASSAEENQLKEIQGTEAVVVDTTSFDRWKHQGQELHLFGSGADKLVALFEDDDQVRVISGVTCTARNLVHPALQAYTGGTFEDLAYFEPQYLKDYMPTTPKKRI